MKKKIGIAIGVSLLICGTLLMYTEWEIRRFKEKLPPHTAVQNAPGAASAIGDTEHQNEDTQTTAPPGKAPALEVTVPGTSAPGTKTDPAIDASDDTEDWTDPLDLAPLFDVGVEEPQNENKTDATQEAPYDEAFVEAGFKDYNAYLQSDPEYAYRRLEEAFREQYGDDPDVDLIVENVRRSNEGNFTIDDAIYHTEAMIRLVSKIYPPEAVQVIVDHLEYLRETKQYSLEAGDEVQQVFNYRFHVGE